MLFLGRAAPLEAPVAVRKSRKSVYRGNGTCRSDLTSAHQTVIILAWGLELGKGSGESSPGSTGWASALGRKGQSEHRSKCRVSE